jgi:hypothetical protein
MMTILHFFVCCLRPGFSCIFCSDHVLFDGEEIVAIVLGEMFMKYRLVLMIGLLGLGACQSDGEREQPEDAGSAGAANFSEHAGATTIDGPVREPSEAEADSLLQLEQQIIQQPENVVLRRELGRRAIDAKAAVIWTVGRGRVNPQASSLGVALSQAEMAATLDASRWTAYLIEWQKNDYATKFGSLQARVPVATVVRKSTNDSLCVVLARAPLQRE